MTTLPKWNLEQLGQITKIFHGKHNAAEKNWGPQECTWLPAVDRGQSEVCLPIKIFLFPILEMVKLILIENR